MVLAAVPVQTARSASTYTEKLNVYVAGSDALWYFTFGGVNGTSGLSGLEGSAGVNWYNVTAIKTAGWTSDFQVFGPRGYGLVPVPFIPSQGLFFTVGADNYTHAAAAADALGSYLLTSFTTYSNGTGTFSFYSPVSFDSLMPNTLLQLVPSGEGGFAKAISSTAFIASSSPFVVLEGVRSSSGFTHDLVVGSISSSALDSSHQPNLMNYFGGSVTYLRASNNSASSAVRLNFLDGAVSSSDPATVVNNNAKFSGSYTLTLSPGKRLSKINATVVQQPAPLLAYRSVDTGVLKAGGNLSVALSFKNLSPSITISKISFSDSWWSTAAGFKLLAGNGTFPAEALTPGASKALTYKLGYAGTSTGSAVIPASVVRYQYTMNGATFNATEVLNPVRLSLGISDAVLYVTVVPTGGVGKSVGTAQNFTVKVTNVGNLPAFSVVAAGHVVGGLAAGGSLGSSANFTVSESASGMLGTNVTKFYSATYQDSSGATHNATTNVVSSLFSHTSMGIGFPVLTVGAQVGSLANSRTNVTLTFTSTNGGPANVTSFSATGALPAGLGCGTTSGKGISCAGGVVTISYPRLNGSSQAVAYMKYNITGGINFASAPFSFKGSDPLGSVTGASNSAAVPAGVVLSKLYAPSQLFGGMTSTVTVSAANNGPLPLYSLTVGSTADSFDSAVSGAVLSKTASVLDGGKNVTVSYGVKVQQVSGTQGGSLPTVSFSLGGSSFSLQGSIPTLRVYQPLGATITTNPATPEEGKNFTITISIENPTTVAVSDVQFTLPVPSGLGLSALVNAHLSSGTLSVTSATLAAGATLTATVSAVASSGITVPFQNAKLTFTYAGVGVNGTVPKSSGIAIGEDVTTRYIIPTVFILIAVAAVAFYVRRKAATVPASQK